MQHVCDISDNSSIFHVYVMYIWVPVTMAWHGMCSGCRRKIQPPDMEGSCINLNTKLTANKGCFFSLRGWVRDNNSLP
jgi:hypothetical protein